MFFKSGEIKSISELLHHLSGVASTDSDFWLPVSFQLQNAMPLCLHGHTATYDPDTKRIYIFGGIREDKTNSSIYILDTITWKWLLVAVSTAVLPRHKHRKGGRPCLNVAIDMSVSLFQ